MAKIRNWHKLESKARLNEVSSISVVWGCHQIKVILRDGEGKRLNLVLSRDEAITLVTRLTGGIHKVRDPLPR